MSVTDPYRDGASYALNKEPIKSDERSRFKLAWWRTFDALLAIPETAESLRERIAHTQGK